MQLANNVAGLLRSRLDGLDQGSKQDGAADMAAAIVEQALCIGAQTVIRSSQEG